MEDAVMSAVRKGTSGRRGSRSGSDNERAPAESESKLAMRNINHFPQAFVVSLAGARWLSPQQFEHLYRLPPSQPANWETE